MEQVKQVLQTKTFLYPFIFISSYLRYFRNIKKHKEIPTSFKIEVYQEQLKININPKNLLRELVSHLNIGGQLAITGLEPSVSEQSPMHFKIKFDTINYIESLGMVRVDQEFLWIKKL